MNVSYGSIRLRELFEGKPTNSSQGLSGTDESAVSALVFDTRELQPGCVFVALRGTKHDGHDFLDEAVRKGAVALVIEDDSKLTDEIRQSYKGYIHVVASTRRELAFLAARFFGSPSKELFTVGVTGTNGKTTTTNMIESVLNAGGNPTGVVGTIDHHLGSRVWPSDMTTPDPVRFQRRLREFVDAGAKAVALEVSSHALDQARVDAVNFDVAIFTNLTRDHLDYHGTMQAYSQAKFRFFAELLPESEKCASGPVTAVFNVDDPAGAEMANRLERLVEAQRVRIWRCGSDDECASRLDFSYRIESQGFDGVRFKLRTPRGEHAVFLAMPGKHNVQNVIGAFATGEAIGMSSSAIVQAIQGIRGVPGRLERVPNRAGIHVFVDYAHTDDALKTILQLLQNVRAESETDAQAKIFTVFGCGGDRDRGKRPMMMKAALAGSDFVIATSDNPRTEDPEKILDDVMAGASSDDLVRVARIVDRRDAISHALAKARRGDVVLIAGKGHEATQQIGTVKHPFSDVQVASEALTALAKDLEKDPEE
ncbi:MAG: UDP-N-acetylmuramoyl-L-alanyl-D-glutamate--2,6-diaminopimelate ligase [Bdellovibrionales bacterium]|jgi:UDP-N-acetylmuramoyl-L-alanyl-D-glutamate--2,6-diaminopimelate ligase|nr:UDP-N-acetylmuramoyl-L-alanyl-D-glutamate--2,6-diaminopimelate ligase [Bdellovibrionales bacterium]